MTIRSMILGVCALVLTAGVAQAETAKSWRDFPGVSNTSYVDASGERALQLSMDIPAPPRAVFEAFATAEGFKRWAVAVARVDLRTGGEIEASYDPKAAIGDANNIRNQIVTFIPNRLLVIRNVQAPAGFPGKDAFQKTVTVIEVAPIATGTRVTLTNTGYGSGPESDTVYKHFEWGNAYTLAELRKRFAGN
ncbi:SRPBCC domain-containing protein [Caulobacter sp.]|uniref:SRPBCC domain-containing protein n=1 Tax=Caulobacter sp. TaxID=78 RepID=UPI00161F9C4F